MDDMSNSEDKNIKNKNNREEQGIPKWAFIAVLGVILAVIVFSVVKLWIWNQGTAETEGVVEGDFSVEVMDQIFLLAPTSVDERIHHVAKIGGGFIYYVSLKGVTGAGNIDVTEVRQRINRIKAIVPFPVAVGFGVRDAETARRLGQAADAVVMGTRLIQEMDKVQPEKAPEAVAAFLKPVRKALDESAV